MPRPPTPNRKDRRFCSSALIDNLRSGAWSLFRTLGREMNWTAATKSSLQSSSKTVVTSPVSLTMPAERPRFMVGHDPSPLVARHDKLLLYKHLPEFLNAPAVEPTSTRAPASL